MRLYPFLVFWILLQQDIDPVLLFFLLMDKVLVEAAVEVYVHVLRLVHFFRPSEETVSSFSLEDLLVTA
uniref:Putative secreted protein n=1 Tax=Panstrongylus lignarius TaxID=156445 RepID=A0A224Y5A7_9HEMI